MSGSPAAVFLSFAAGLGVAFQAGINGHLARRIGTFPTAAFSASVTTVALYAIVLVSGRGGVADAFRQPAWLWVGGLMGAVGLSATSYAPSRIGVFGTLAVLLAAQLLGATLIDAFGWLGVTRVGFPLQRVVGLVLLAGGSLLVLRK